VSDPLTELLTQSHRPRILVVGDVMLDRYVWGEVERISPEGPIPVLRVGRREDRLGGAGSVATMLAALEADVTLATAVGDDAEGRRVVELLERLDGDTDCDVDCIVTDGDRSTTLKERFLGRTHHRYPQQMMRVDHEDTRPIDAALARRLLASIEQRLDRIDLVLVSDYDKGVCEDRFLAELIALARRNRVPVVADPVRGADYTRYRGCTCITPNRTEAAAAVRREIVSAEDGLDAARRLLEFGVDAAVVTLDRDGIAWADTEGNGRLFPVRERQVYDITGAGDMVISALGYARASGADWPTAIELANLAASLEVERLGVVPVRRDELLAELSRNLFSTGQKIVPLDRLEEPLLGRRRAGHRIVMTNGCFDLLHPGHVASLEVARSQGDCLLVGLNSDRSVRRLKGDGHPILDQQSRAAMLAALACVDYVVIFDDTSVHRLVRRVSPDVLVKSAEYVVSEVVGHEIVRRHGGRVVLAPTKGRHSTSGLIERIQRIAAPQHPTLHKKSA
jgi:D-beta-D-heptose 7-phosphate kinase/D-beta-D-heptose 1-phosphate adenosyltransferase